MLEDAPNQQDSNPVVYDPLRQALLRPIQHQLARQGVHVSPEEALLLLEQQIDYDAKRGVQQQLAEQGIVVSPDEAPKLFMQKFMHDIKCDIQRDLAEQGIDATPDEAVAIHKLRFYHRLMKRIGFTEPDDTP